MNYAIVTDTSLSFEAALEKVTAFLREEGFGILTEIDVQATFKKKLDRDFKKYRILGACNPLFAHHSLEAENLTGVFLPCNVVVYEGDGGKTVVAAMEPRIISQFIQNPKLKETADEVGSRLEKVIRKMGEE
ncbi:MAG: DUF302 domain-containing protein [Candidatus Xenobiia bacterium LiM19]